MTISKERMLKGYELLERIGSGGFGAVYRAYQSTINREVAIKIILPGYANHPNFIRRFEIEAKVIARLEHPYIVPLYDYWRDPNGAYLVMRWLRGGSLGQKLHRDGAFNPTDTALLLDQLTRALDLAHRHEVIHRDIKPGNILLDEDNNAYLADFGIAKDLAGLDIGQTGADDIVGSMDYLSPEQARSEPVTSRTDIYSLGVMLYEILTGKHPFHEVSLVERLYKHIHDPLPEINRIDLNIRHAVNEVIQKATAKDPAHRYDDVLTFSADFRRAVHATDNLATRLTQREHEVLLRLAEGLSYKQIAGELHIAVSTVQSYVKQLYSKLGVRSRVQATVRARELDLLGAGLIPEIVSTSNMPEPENPYKGLRAFEATDHRDFFGRKDLVQKLVSKMDDDSDMARFLAVIGPSGSGKSSLVNAGLIPAIWNGGLPGSDRWFIVEMLPGEHPMEELEVALTRVASNAVNNLNQHLWRDNRGLLRASKLILPPDDTELLLVVDQFEELFTLVQDEAERQQFLDIVHTAVLDIRSRVRVVVTLRADFFDRPLYYPEFGDLLHSRIATVLPLSAKGLEKAIVGPCDRIHITFEAGLVAQIVSEMTYQASALPLLQYALTELFEQREGRVLTHEAYQQIGGAVGALAKRAESLFTDMDETQQTVTRQMFLRLVTPGEGKGDTRRRTPRSELLAIATQPDVMDEVIDMFSIYRLLSLDHDPATRSPTVEVAHEAILHEWERLRIWININREEIKMQQQLSRMADEWQLTDQDPSYLASGTRLQQMEAWVHETQFALTENERLFLDTSIAEHNRRKKMEETRKAREASLERRSKVVLRALVGVFALAAFIAIGLSIFAFNERSLAEQARETSDANLVIANSRADEIHSLSLITSAQQMINVNPTLALALAIEANKFPNAPALAQQFLPKAANTSRMIRHIPTSDRSIQDIAVSPDGQTVLAGATDGALMLYDPTTGEMLREFEGHEETISTVAFSSDGHLALSGSTDDTIILWDVATGDMVRQFIGHEGAVKSVKFSPDDKTILSGSADSTLILWDVATGDIMRHLREHSESVTSVAFSPNGEQFISGSNDKTAIVWDVATGETLQRLEEHRLGVRAVAFHPNLNHAVSGGSDNSLIVWNLRTGTILARLESHDSTITSVEYSPDARTILSTSASGMIILWKPLTDTIVYRFGGHQGFVSSAKFFPDSNTAISGSFDKSLIVWDMQTGVGELRRFEGHDDQVLSVAVSPDGQTILSSGGFWSGDANPNTARPDVNFDLILWDANNGDMIRRFEGHTNNVWDVEFSPDGKQALSASADKTLILWDLTTGEIIRTFEGHDRSASDVTFSQDGQRALSGAYDNKIKLWDLTTGEIIRTFEGHRGNVMEAVFSPDETMILSAGGSDEDAILWDIESGEIIHRLEGHTWWVDGVAFHPDGQRVMTSSSDTTMILWDVKTGEPIREFVGHEGFALKVAFSANGQTAISAGNDSDVILWDVEAGEIIQRFTGHIGGVVHVAVSPDGDWVVSASRDGTVRMWAINTDALTEWIRANRFVPEFTCEERSLYAIEPLCKDETVQQD